MKFRDRRAIEAEIRSAYVVLSKMEWALDAKYEHLRKLQKALSDANDEPVDSWGEEEASEAEQDSGVAALPPEEGNRAACLHRRTEEAELSEPARRTRPAHERDGGLRL